MGVCAPLPPTTPGLELTRFFNVHLFAQSPRHFPPSSLLQTSLPLSSITQIVSASSLC